MQGWRFRTSDEQFTTMRAKAGGRGEFREPSGQHGFL
jgi:hypothetical protein